MKHFNFFVESLNIVNGDWGLGIGDLGVGGWGPTPETPPPTTTTKNHTTKKK